MIELVPARLGHAITLARQLKPSLLGGNGGIDPRRAVARLFADSRRARALKVDGRVVAVYGLVGALLSGEAMIWLMASPDVRRHARAFVAACRDEMQALAGERCLFGWVATEDETAMRFAVHWGFRDAGDAGPLRKMMIERDVPWA